MPAWVCLIAPVLAAAEFTDFERISEPGWEDDQPVVAVDQQGRRWVAWVASREGANAVSVSSGGHVFRVTDSGFHRNPAIAVDARGWVHVAWAEREGDEWHLYESVYLAERWSRASRLTPEGSSNIEPVMASGPDGRIALVWQSLREGRAVIMMRLWEARGWSREQQVSVAGGNAWAPSAAWGGGQLWVAWDAYQTGNYSVYARVFQSTVPGPIGQVSGAGHSAVRPSIAVTGSGIPVVSWEEWDSTWGRDFPFLSDRESATITGSRRIQVAFLGDGDWRRLAAPGDSLPPDLRRPASKPQLLLDSGGRMVLAFRVLTAASAGRSDYRAAVDRWDSWLTQWDGAGWLPAFAVPLSTGRYSMGPSLAARDQVHISWPSDPRIQPADGRKDQDIYAGTIRLSGSPPAVGSGESSRIAK